MGNNISGSTERYALISVGQPVDPASVTSVGAVDILGRQGMKEFVATLLGVSPRIECVTKVEDLLPLLQLASWMQCSRRSASCVPFRQKASSTSRRPARKAAWACPVLVS
jgi:hypothetical protein